MVKIWYKLPQLQPLEIKPYLRAIKNQISNTETINQINTLEDLIACLDKGRFDEVLDQIQEMVITKEECEDFIFWDKDNYTRNCIERTDEFELLVLCWEAGQGSAIHSHDKQDCWVKVIEGKFEERVYTYNNETHEMDRVSKHQITNNEVTFMEEPSHFHQLTNVGDQPAISLHLYMKPIRKCQVYDNASKNLVTLPTSDFSLFGEVL